MRVRTFTFNLMMAAWVAGLTVGHFLGSGIAPLAAAVVTALAVVIFINLIDRA